MKLKVICLGLLVAVSTMMAGEFVDYKALTKKLKAEAKKKWYVCNYK